jgi:hypothetical protein
LIGVDLIIFCPRASEKELYIVMGGEERKIK